MNAGSLRHSLRIERPVRTPDTYGAASAPTWTYVDNVQASVRPLRAVEILRAQQVGMETGYVIKMRFRTDITPDCRLKWLPYPEQDTAQILYITGIINVDGRSRELEFLCTERGPANG